MKTLSIIVYAIGSILLMISCFIESITLTWWFGGFSILFLIIGCVFLFSSNMRSPMMHHDHKY